MECHLTKIESFREYSEFCRSLEILEVLLDKSHLSLGVLKCKDCGQLYLEFYKEVTLADGDDDNWNFYVPISKEESEDIRNDISKCYQLFNQRKYFEIRPDGTNHWCTNPLDFKMVAGMF